MSCKSTDLALQTLENGQPAETIAKRAIRLPNATPPGGSHSIGQRGYLITSMLDRPRAVTATTCAAVPC